MIENERSLFNLYTNGWVKLIQLIDSNNFGFFLILQNIGHQEGKIPLLWRQKQKF